MKMWYDPFVTVIVDIIDIVVVVASFSTNSFNKEIFYWNMNRLQYTIYVLNKRFSFGHFMI